MSERKVILVADSPRVQKITTRALSERFKLVFTTNLAGAQQLLRESEKFGRFDLVIADAGFDGGKMVDLLEYIRSVDHFDLMPFLPVRTGTDDLGAFSEPFDENLQRLGSQPLLVLEGFEHDEISAKLTEAVQDSFDKSVAQNRVDGSPRNKIGSQVDRELRE